MSAISELTTIQRTKPKTEREKQLQKKEAGRDNKAGYLFLLGNATLVKLRAGHPNPEKSSQDQHGHR
jgi:hypothetical protein